MFTTNEFVEKIKEFEEKEKAWEALISCFLNSALSILNKSKGKDCLLIVIDNCCFYFPSFIRWKVKYEKYEFLHSLEDEELDFDRQIIDNLLRDPIPFIKFPDSYIRFSDIINSRYADKLWLNQEPYFSMWSQFVYMADMFMPTPKHSVPQFERILSSFNSPVSILWFAAIFEDYNFKHNQQISIIDLCIRMIRMHWVCSKGKEFYIGDRIAHRNLKKNLFDIHLKRNEDEWNVYEKLIDAVSNDYSGDKMKRLVMGHFAYLHPGLDKYSIELDMPTMFYCFPKDSITINTDFLMFYQDYHEEIHASLIDNLKRLLKKNNRQHSDEDISSIANDMLMTFDLENLWSVRKRLIKDKYLSMIDLLRR